MCQVSTVVSLCNHSCSFTVSAPDPKPASCSHNCLGPRRQRPECPTIFCATAWLQTLQGMVEQTAQSVLLERLAQVAQPPHVLPAGQDRAARLAHLLKTTASVPLARASCKLAIQSAQHAHPTPTSLVPWRLLVLMARQQSRTSRQMAGKHNAGHAPMAGSAHLVPRHLMTAVCSTPLTECDRKHLGSMSQCMASAAYGVVCASCVSVCVCR